MGGATPSCWPQTASPPASPPAPNSAGLICVSGIHQPGSLSPSCPFPCRLLCWDSCASSAHCLSSLVGVSPPPRGLADQPWLRRISPSVSVLCPLLQPKLQHARGTSVVFPLLPRGTGACSVSAVRGDGHAEGARARRGAGTAVVAGLP